MSQGRSRGGEEERLLICRPWLPCVQAEARAWPWASSSSASTHKEHHPELHRLPLMAKSSLPWWRLQVKELVQDGVQLLQPTHGFLPLEGTQAGMLPVSRFQAGRDYHHHPNHK
jgi:hypothetical protein